MLYNPKELIFVALLIIITILSIQLTQERHKNHRLISEQDYLQGQAYDDGYNIGYNDAKGEIK